MAAFKQKKIIRGQSLADKLKKARLEQEISLEEVQSQTNIQLKYLEALEEGKYQDLPGDVYVKIWIKLYAEFLDLPANELITAYKLEKNISDKIKGVDQSIKEPIAVKENVLLQPRTLKLIAIGLVVLALLGYLAWSLVKIIAAPKINITEPANNYTTTESSIVITGQTEAEVQLMINNELILIDEQGNFSQTVNLSTGLNKLQISVKKKHSKTNNLEWNILRKEL